MDWIALLKEPKVVVLVSGLLVISDGRFLKNHLFL
jgi:hypothetical protein